MNRYARVEIGTQPFFKRSELQLTRAPSRPRGGKKIAILVEPEIEVAIGIEAQDRLSQEPFKPIEKGIDLRQLLAGIGEEILERQFRMVLPHVDGQRRAIAPA